jgi:hypothetical protein
MSLLDWLTTHQCGRSDALATEHGAQARSLAITMGCVAVMSAAFAGSGPAVAQTTARSHTANGTKSDSGSAGEQHHRLSGRELRTLLAKGASFRAQPEGLTNSARQHEIFYADGRYVGCSDLAFIHARFEIRDSRRCLVGNGGPSCRIIYRIAPDEYQQRDIAEDGHVLGPTGLSITPSNAGETCFSRGGKT